MRRLGRALVILLLVAAPVGRLYWGFYTGQQCQRAATARELEELARLETALATFHSANGRRPTQEELWELLRGRSLAVKSISEDELQVYASPVNSRHVWRVSFGDCGRTVVLLEPEK